MAKSASTNHTLTEILSRFLSNRNFKLLKCKDTVIFIYCTLTHRLSLNSIYNDVRDTLFLPHGLLTQLYLWTKRISTKEMVKITTDCKRNVDITGKEFNISGMLHFSNGGVLAFFDLGYF